MSTRIYHSLKKIGYIASIVCILLCFTVKISIAQTFDTGLGTVLSTINPAFGAAFQLAKPSIKESAAQVVTFGIESVINLITSLLSFLILPMVSLFLFLCSAFFEYVIYFTIVQMHAIAGDNAIVQIWTIIRDTLNIAVIFILVYLAIRIIIGQGENVKKIIAGVIVFGVLTNFSLFFTKAAIDLSNIIALEFYQNLRTKDLNQVLGGENVLSGGISSTILDKTSIKPFFASWLHSPDIKNISETKKEDNLRSSLVYVIGIIIAISAIALVLLQAAFMFLFRLIALLLILIFSPLMFAGGLFTPLKGKIEQWWGGFTSQLIFAPLFFILLYIGVFALDTLTTIASEMKDDGFIPFVITNFLITIIVIIGFGKILEISKGFSTDLGNSAAGWASKKASGLLSGAAGLGFGGAAIALRSGAKKIGLNKLSQNIETSDSAVVRRLGALTGLSNLQNKTFDIRNSALAQKAAGGVMGALNSASGGLTSNLNIGEGSKTTLDQQKIRSIAEMKEDTKEWWNDYEGTKKARELRKQREEAPKKEAEAKQKKLEDRETDRINEILDRQVDALGIEKYSDLDTTIKYYDAGGTLQTITRNMTTHPDTEKGNSDWAKEVTKYNAANARHEFKVKQETLKRNVDIAITQTEARRQGAAGIARYNAQANRIKALNNTPEAKLEKWKSVLVYNPGNTETEINGISLQNIIGVTNVDDILTASDDQVKAYWDVIKSHCEQEKKLLLPAGTNLSTLSQADKDAYRNLTTLEAKAKSASSNIDSLKKEIGEKNKA